MCWFLFAGRHPIFSKAAAERPPDAQRQISLLITNKGTFLWLERLTRYKLSSEGRGMPLGGFRLRDNTKITSSFRIYLSFEMGLWSEETELLQFEARINTSNQMVPLHWILLLGLRDGRRTKLAHFPPSCPFGRVYSKKSNIRTASPVVSLCCQRLHVSGHH